MRRAMSTERDEHPCGEKGTKSLRQVLNLVGGDSEEPGILCNGRRTDSRGVVGEVLLGH
jgi:hypothetical protein